MSWTAQINGLTGLSPELQAAARLGIHDGMELLGVEGQRMVQDNIASPFNGKPAAMDTQVYLNSIVSDVYDEQALTRLVVGVSQTGGADKYAAPVETGARPHMPPVEALVPWVMRKLDPKDEKQALSIAWAIATKMRKQGTTGHEDFERALIDLEPMAPPILERAIASRMMMAGAV
jgi:hypothetical protein